jgi:hypothetical protein
VCLCACAHTWLPLPLLPQEYTVNAIKGKCWVFARADYIAKVRELGEKLGSAFNKEDCYWYTKSYDLDVGEFRSSSQLWTYDVDKDKFSDWKNQSRNVKRKYDFFDASNEPQDDWAPAADGVDEDDADEKEEEEKDQNFAMMSQMPAAKAQKKRRHERDSRREQKELEGAPAKDRGRHPMNLVLSPVSRRQPIVSDTSLGDEPDGPVFDFPGGSDLGAWHRSAVDHMANLKVVQRLGLLDYGCHIQPAFQDLSDSSPLRCLQTRLVVLRVETRGSPAEMKRKYLQGLQDIIAWLEADHGKAARTEEAALVAEEGRETREAKEREAIRVRAEKEKKVGAKELRRQKAEEDEKLKAEHTRKEETLLLQKKKLKAQEKARRVELEATKTKNKEIKVKKAAETEALIETRKRAFDEERRRQRKAWTELKAQLEALQEAKEVREETRRREDEEEARACSEELEQNRQDRFRREDEEAAQRKQAQEEDDRRHGRQTEGEREKEKKEKEKKARASTWASPAVSSADDDCRWDAFVAKFGGKRGGCLVYEDVPWPQSAFNPPEPESWKKYFNKLLLRWHPDKFNDYGNGVLDDVLLEVNEVAKRLLPAMSAYRAHKSREKTHQTQEQTGGTNWPG